MKVATPYGLPGALPRADGQPRCTNCDAGSYNHECGAVAKWIGTSSTGHRAAYCDDCLRHGREGRRCTSVEKI